MQFGSVQLSRQAVPDDDRKIFGGGNLVAKLGNFLIQVPMVEVVDHFMVHEVFKLLEVHDEAGALVNLTSHSDFQRVIVAVPMRIVALAEDALVFFR